MARLRNIRRADFLHFSSVSQFHFLKILLFFLLVISVSVEQLKNFILYLIEVYQANKNVYFFFCNLEAYLKLKLTWKAEECLLFSGLSFCYAREGWNSGILVLNRIYKCTCTHTHKIDVIYNFLPFHRIDQISNIMNETHIKKKGYTLNIWYLPQGYQIWYSLLCATWFCSILSPKEHENKWFNMGSNANSSNCFHR